MSEKSPKKDSQVSQKIQDAFIDLYETHPIEKISIKMITDRAGLYRGTFYLHYMDIYDLRDQIVAEYKTLIESISDRSTIELLQHGRLQDALPDFSFYTSHKKYLQVLFCDYTKSDLYGYMKSRLKESLVANIPALDPDVDPLNPYLLEYITSAEVSVIIQWIKNDMDLPLEVVSKFMSDISSMGVIDYLKEQS